MAALVAFPYIFNFSDIHTWFKTWATRASSSITHRYNQACYNDRSFIQFGPFKSHLSFVQDPYSKSWYALVAWTRVYLTKPNSGYTK